MSPASARTAGDRTVLVYSDDPAVRERIRMAVGWQPAEDVGRLEYVEASSEPEVVRLVDAGGIDLCIFDGEAWPAGGMGVCRQLKYEIEHCPPIVILIGRRDDRWLAAWARADGVLAHPLDAVTAAETVAEVLRSADGGPSPAAAPAEAPIPTTPATG